MTYDEVSLTSTVDGLSAEYADLDVTRSRSPCVRGTFTRQGS